MIEEIPDDDEWKNQSINSIDDDMDLLISYINGDMDRNIWINAKSTMATEIQAEINLKKKVLQLEEQIPKEFHDFLSSCLSPPYSIWTPVDSLHSQVY